MSNIQNIDQHIIINVAERIERLIKDARQHINRIVDITEVITKYEIGHVIIEVVQEGEDRARYGKQLLKGVSEILTERLGEGWSVDTLKKCRKFYQIYSANKIGATLSPQLTIEDSGYSVAQIQKTATSQKLDSAYPFTLSWSHYVVLMRMESADERRFYEIEAKNQNWSVRQLQRQYNSSLYERLALSKDKEAILRLAQEGQTINKPDDIIKNPLTLEFLGLKPDASYSETKFENAIIDKLQQFLLEMLCKGLHNISSRKCCRLSRMDCSKSFSVTKACSFNPKNSKVTGVLITSLGCNKVACCWTKAERASLFLESPLRS